jgi:hypothetical protein
MLRKISSGAPGKKEPLRTRRRFRVGDRVKIVDISAELKNPNYDLKDAEHRGMRTAELLRFCVGRIFTVYGLDRYGNIELHVGNSSAVRKRFGKWHSIWCEPKFVRLVKSKKLSS